MKTFTKSALRITLAALAVASGALLYRYTGLPFWQTPQHHPLTTLQATTPNGSPLPLAPFEQQITVINFWATWCPPCIEEMPELNSIYPQLKARNIELLGIAIDNPEAVQAFLKTTAVNYPIALIPTAQELSTSLGNSQGGLPFTVVLDAKGRKIGEKLGKISAEELMQLLPAKP